MTQGEYQVRDSRYAPAGESEHIELARTLMVGDRVKFEGESKARDKVVARGDRYVILTAPFNLGTRFGAKQIYTIIDLQFGIRGTHDSYGHGVESDEQVAATIRALEAEEIGISVRNNVRLEIAVVKPRDRTPKDYVADDYFSTVFRQQKEAEAAV